MTMIPMDGQTMCVGPDCPLAVATPKHEGQEPLCGNHGKQVMQSANESGDRQAINEARRRVLGLGPLPA